MESLYSVNLYVYSQFQYFLEENMPAGVCLVYIYGIVFATVELFTL